LRPNVIRRVDQAKIGFGGLAVPTGTVDAVEDYATCALGDILNAAFIPEFNARIVAGAANIQFATPSAQRSQSCRTWRSNAPARGHGRAGNGTVRASIGESAR
jgi:hypothetical protein